MKKRILSVGMAALMLGTAACSLPAATVTTVCAADVSAALEKLKYKVVDGESITITYCDQSVTEIEIPAEIEGMPVTAIGQSAFFRCTSLK